MTIRHVRSSAIGLAAAWCVCAATIGAQQRVSDATMPRSDTSANDLLARRITLRLDRIGLDRAIQIAAQKAHGEVLFEGRVVDRYRRDVTLNVDNMPLGQVLDSILTGTRLQVTRSAANSLIVRETMSASRVDAGSVMGTIVDVSTKRAVVGATVTIEGTKMSVRTGEDGTYRVSNVPAGSYTLVIRRLGYTVVRKSITVNDGATLPVDITLAATSTPLQEVVTTVTGPQRRLEIGNAIGRVKADSLVKEAPITSVSQLLTARVPGVLVSQGQGTVGGNVKVQIRGLTSISLTSDPIVIVDGMRYTSRAASTGRSGEKVSPLNDINPNDIETVEIVKGPSAATLYGTDAANGVIVITTKRGKAGPARWTAFAKGMTDEVPTSRSRIPDVYYGWASSYDGVPGTVRYCDLASVARGACVQDSVTHQSNSLNNDETSVLRPAQSYGYGASVSGGQQNLRYLFSASYDDLTGAIALPKNLIQLFAQQQGVSKLPDEFLRPNTQSSLNLRSNVTASLGSQIEMAVSGGYVRGNTHSVGTFFAPYRQSVTGNSSADWGARDVRDALLQQSTESNDRFLGSAQGQARVSSWLTTRATIGLDVAQKNGRDFSPRDSLRGAYPEGYIYEGRTRQTATSADVGATATLKRGRASMRTSIGAQYVHTLQDVLDTRGSNLTPGATTISRAASISSSQDYTETATLGSYVEETIGLNDRLFLTGALRIDGASTFGKGYSATSYPKLSASWLLSDEPFMPKMPKLDELRVRMAYGATGRQPEQGWSLPWYSITNIPAGAGGGRHMTFRGIGNAGIRPERGQELETGIDAGFFDRRAQLELTWYHRRTTDQIVNVGWRQDIDPQYHGNIGLTTEHGFESRLSATLIDTRPLHWTMTFMHASNGTRLVRAGDAANFIVPDGSYREGYPLGARFITPLVGYSDADGNGFISENEVQLGDSMIFAGLNYPPRTQTLTTTIGLFSQRLRLSALLDRQSGGTLINDYASDCYYCQVNFDPTMSLAQQAYRAARNIFKPGLPQFRYIESGSLTRLREVTMALTLPTRITRALRVESSSASLSVRNLALWSRFSGPDPESGDTEVRWIQANPGGIPQARTWSLRFDLGL